MEKNQNISEELVTEINSQVFFKEFTFSKNEFYPKDGKKELADNILVLDNLLFIIQVKERNIEEAKKSNDYHVLITEIAKLKRYELPAFKERYLSMIDLVKKNEFSMPLRFYNIRTDCAFVFLPLSRDLAFNWEKALINFTEVYKYKRKATKAIGVVCFKQDGFIDINWTMFKKKWEFNEELKHLVKLDTDHYGNGEILIPPRYKLKKN